MRKRFKVKLELDRKSVSEVYALGTSVVTHVTGNSFFATPHPALADVSTALTDLNTAMDNANGGGLEETSIMYDKLRIVKDLLTELGHYVEDIANDPSNADQETTVIDSAGMLVKGFTPRQKRVLTAIAASVTGVINLFARGERRAFHEWMYTATPGDVESWISLPSTQKADTSVSGLTALTVYYFRHRAVFSNGPTAWEDPVSEVAPR